MKLMTRGEFIAANISGTNVTAEKYEMVYDVVRCLCDNECPGWKSELKKEGEPDYLKSSHDWYLPEEAKGLVYHEVPPASGEVSACAECAVIFWTEEEIKKHAGHKVEFVTLGEEFLKFLRGEPSKIKMIYGTAE